MATLRRLLGEIKSVQDEIREKFNEAESIREHEYNSAVKIQAWYRGLRVRRKLAHLRKKVIDMQRFWRGYVDRRSYRNLLKEKLFQERVMQFHECAKFVQKMWRGYYVRKYIFNYYAQKNYLQTLMVKNEAVRKELRMFEDEMRLKDAEKELEAKRKAQIDWAFHNHHLLSTSVIPGVYGSSQSNQGSVRRGYSLEAAEDLLRSVRPKPSDTYLDKMNPMFKLEKELALDVAALQYHITDREPVLPPLDKVPPRPQGPFRSTEEVLRQRYRYFKPSLRVQSDFYGLEKARDGMKFEELGMRIHEKPFKPVHSADLPYQKLHISTTPFGHLKYGTKHFRELEDPPVSFKSVLPPIPIFDNFNDTYSRGAVGL